MSLDDVTTIDFEAKKSYQGRKYEFMLYLIFINNKL